VKNKVKVKIQNIIHPFLFAIYPILFLYSNNIDQTPFTDTLIPLAVVLTFVILSIMIGVVVKKIEKAALFVSLFIFLFFSFGHIYEASRGFKIYSLAMDGPNVLFYLWISIFILTSYFLIRARRDLGSLTKMLNIIAIVLVAFPLTSIVSNEISGIYSDKEIDNPRKEAKTKGSLKEKDRLPDIYYIVLDGFASESTLNDVYDYNSSEFSKSLEEKGFFVVDEGRSNYALTWLSLSSFLNMEYINFMSEKYVSNDTHIHNKKRIRDNEVLRVLKRLGYKTVHINSGYTLTDGNENADLEVDCDNLNEFPRLLLETTLLNRFNSLIIGSGIRERIHCSLSRIGSYADDEGPTYVFAHLVTPHPPNVFGRNGEIVTQEEKAKGGNYWGKRYLNQLIYISKKVEELSDEIISKSKEPPIIIFQADHGPMKTFYDDNNVDNGGWASPTDENLKERMRIFNAIYVSEDKRDILYKDITPVNMLRAVFNAYFDMDYEILEDKSYYSNYETPYSFKDVTDVVDFN